MNDTGIRVSVDPYSKSLGSTTNVPVGLNAIAYDCPHTHRTAILFLPYSLSMDTLDHHLLSTFQLRAAGVVVNDVALQHTSPDDRDVTTHCIVIMDPTPFVIPLNLDGIMSGFLTRKPTWDEINDPEGTDVLHFYLTPSEPWNPRDPLYADIETTLQADLARGYSLTETGPRDLSQLQLRGQSLDPRSDCLSELLSLPYEPPSEPVNEADPEGTEGTDCDSEGTPEPAEPPDEEPTATIAFLECLDWEQRSIAAIEVDRYAASLLSDSGKISALGAHLSAATTIRKRKGHVSPEKLSKNWLIGMEVAKRTVEATTQLAVRDFSHTTGGRRLKPYAWMLKFPRRQCAAYTDTLFSKVKSLRGNTCCQVYVTDCHAVAAYPMKSKADAHLSLDDYFRQHGIPQVMTPDNAKELTQKDFLKKCRKAQCPIHPIEPHTPNQNMAESAIRELKRLYMKAMVQKGTPQVLWDHCIEWCALVRSHTALNIHSLEGETPMCKLTGETPDISFLSEFGWYDWVWYISPPEGGKQPNSLKKRLGRYLGPAMTVGDALCAKVFTERAQVLVRSSVIPLTEVDHNSEDIQEMKRVWREVLKEKLKDRIKGLDDGKSDADSIDPDVLELEDHSDYHWLDVDDAPDYTSYEAYSPEELNLILPPTEDEGKSPLPELAEADDLDLNRYISAKVMLPRDGIQFANGVVLRRARDENGELIGKSSTNPLLDTSVYEVRFEDGAVERYHANIIAEHIYAQIDGDGYGRTLLDEIVDHRMEPDAIAKEDGWMKGFNGQLKRKQTTRGWSLLVRFKDRSEQWIKLKDLKESNPVELAEYAEANQLLDEPAFAWWAPWTLKQRTRLLKAMKKRYFRTTQKFGIEIPKTVKRALEIDKETGTTFWEEAIKKEMGVVMVAFDILPEGKKPPPGYSFIGCHMVFDVKQGTLQRKARFVADGSKTDVSDVPTYASVVSRESVRIAFLLAALNDLDIWAADCEGAYLNAKTREKLYTRCGPEFGENAGRYAILVRALYGSKSAAASWRATISKVIEELGYEMCRADNDVWMKKGPNCSGTIVWTYILVYSDDLLVIAAKPKDVLDMIGRHFKLKDGSVKRPTQYLGADIGKHSLPNGYAWFQSPDSYVKEAITNVERWLSKQQNPELQKALKTKVSCMLPSGYKPELDVSPLLGDEEHSFYQQQIGVLRWMNELGRIDILTEVSMLAAFTAAPRQGHLAALLHLYAFLKKHYRSRIVFDPTKFDHPEVPEYDWIDQYKVECDKRPPGAPEPLGESIQTTCFVDSDHAGDLVSRRSRTGVLIFCNRAPIVWYSKKQGSIETASFGSELSAMKSAVELIEGLRYKLQMMGCRLDGPTHVKADNMSVIHNCSNPASQLKKKSCSIAYNYVRERSAARVILVSYVSTNDNWADMFTKTQPGPVRLRLASNVLYSHG